MFFQGMTIFAFNNERFNFKTLKEVLSLGPTYVVMKLIESVLDVIMMYGAYSTSRRVAVSRIFLRFIWFSIASVFICFLYVKALEDNSNQKNVVYGKSVRLRVYLCGGRSSSKKNFFPPPLPLFSPFSPFPSP